MDTIIFDGKKISKDSFVEKVLQYNETINKINTLGLKIETLNQEQRKELIELVKFASAFETALTMNAEEVYLPKDNLEIRTVINAIAKFIPIMLEMKNNKINSSEIYTKMMKLPAVKKYFKDFKFNVASGHNQKHYHGDNNVSFPFEYNSENGSFIFRFMDSVFDIVKYYKGFESENAEVIAEKILTCKISDGCFVCGQHNELTFDHKNKTIVDAKVNSCAYADKNTDELTCEVATTGKLFICNDLREILSDSNRNTLRSDMYALARQLNCSGSLNDLQGQQFNVNAFAQLMKAAYVVAGNHGCSPIQYSGNNIKLHYWEEGKKNISLSLWGVFIVDYDTAKAIAIENGKLTEFEEMDSVVLNVEPGTYKVTSILQDDCADDCLEYFSEITKISDKVDFYQFNREDWDSRINFN